MVRNNADVNYRNIDGVTPLMIAARFNRLEIVEYLLSIDKINVNLVDNKKLSALIYATTSFTPQMPAKMIELLVRKGADVNHHDSFGCSVLKRIISSSSESNLTGTELVALLTFINDYIIILIFFKIILQVALLIDHNCDLENRDWKLKPIHLSMFE